MGLAPLLSMLMKLSSSASVCVQSHFSHVLFFATLWTVAHQVPLSMGFSRREYWSGLPYPPSFRDLPDPETEPISLMSPVLAGRFFTIRVTWDVLIMGANPLNQGSPTSGI